MYIFVFRETSKERKGRITEENIEKKSIDFRKKVSHATRGKDTIQKILEL